MIDKTSVATVTASGFGECETIQTMTRLHMVVVCEIALSYCLSDEMNGVDFLWASLNRTEPPFEKSAKTLSGGLK